METRSILLGLLASIIDVAQPDPISIGDYGVRVRESFWLGRGMADEDAQEERVADQALPRLQQAVRLAEKVGARLGERALLLAEMRRQIRSRQSIIASGGCRLTEK